MRPFPSHFAALPLARGVRFAADRRRGRGAYRRNGFDDDVWNVWAFEPSVLIPLALVALIYAAGVLRRGAYTKRGNGGGTRPLPAVWSRC